ncbi:DUF3833 family protein [uncultured Sphingomonas sp.]|uniref:DUF3833 family protein n=1 Tax=uncultured Sphingomonas sp. TaxID=158754 RepID=UPI0035CA2D5A
MPRACPIAHTAAVLTLAACAPAAAPAALAAAPTPVFDPLIFFAGLTEGTAKLKIVLRAARAVRVEGSGTIRPDGALVLDQTVAQEGKPATRRRWRIHRTGPTTYAGTLSDAVGPIAGEVTGNRLHLSFTMKGGLATDQWLTLSPDGRSAANILTARKFGVTVARLDETIRKLD